MKVEIKKLGNDFQILYWRKPLSVDVSIDKLTDEELEEFIGVLNAAATKLGNYYLQKQKAK